MEYNVVGVGSRVTVEVYLGKLNFEHTQTGRRTFTEYERYSPNGSSDWVETYLITDDPLILEADSKGTCLHPRSFAGRKLMGAIIGQEVEVNIGGVRIKETRPRQASGNHLKYKVVLIE